MACFAYKMASTNEAIDKIYEEILHNLVSHCVAPDERRHFFLVVSEAVTNAFLHGNKQNSSKMIDVIIWINNKRLRADIIDQGQGGLIKVDDKKDATSHSESGRGVDLMKHFCREARFEETSTGGLKVTLVVERELVNA